MKLQLVVSHEMFIYEWVNIFDVQVRGKDHNIVSYCHGSMYASDQQ